MEPSLVSDAWLAISKSCKFEQKLTESTRVCPPVCVRVCENMCDTFCLNESVCEEQDLENSLLDIFNESDAMHALKCVE